MLTIKRLNQYILADIFSPAWVGEGVSDIDQSKNHSHRHYHTLSLDQPAGLNHRTLTVRQAWTLIP